MAGVHPDHFTRLFRKTTGSSYVDFIANIRIAKAHERLLTTKDSLLEIARNVGYKDEFYFSRKFKQVVGTAPAIYRKKPKTIFSLASIYTAGLLAVGHVPPVGSVTPWLSRRYDGALRQGALKPFYWDTCDIGRLKEQPRPDIILCHDMQFDEAHMERLRGIAPTIAIPFDSMDWREQFVTVAELAGEAANARDWLDKYDARIEAAKDRIARQVDRRETVLILEIWSDELMVYGDTYGRAGDILYRSFGLAPPRNVKERVMKGTGYLHIGKKQLGDYDADLLFLIVHEDRASRRTADLLKNSEEWSALRAVKDRRVYEFDGGLFYGCDPVSTEAQLQQIVRSLSESSR